MKVHARKRFQRVFATGDQLKLVAEECLDGFSRYEIEAYVESMQASYLIEVGKWQLALDKLMRAKILYQKIMTLKDSIEAVIYSEKISQIDTFVRLCCGKLQKKNVDKAYESEKKSLSDTVSKAYSSTK